MCFCTLNKKIIIFRIVIGLVIILAVQFCVMSMKAMAANDYDPPVITGVFMDDPGVVVKSGDTLNFYIAVTDESELKSACIGFEYIDPSGTLRSLGTKRGEYNSDTGIYTMSLPIPDTALAGTYTIDELLVSDYYGNDTRINRHNNPDNIDLDDVYFTVEGGISDYLPPVITGVFMDDPGVVVKSGDTLNFYIAVTDESELKSACIGFEYIDPSGTLRSLGTKRGEYNSDTGIYTMSLPIPDTALAGTYTIDELFVSDYYGNDTRINRHNNPDNIDLDDVYFTVEGGISDYLPPVITGVFMDDPGVAVKSGDTLNFYIAVTDESELKSAWIGFEYIDPSGTLRSLGTKRGEYNSDTGIYTMSLPIPDTALAGTYTIDELFVSDYYGNDSRINRHNNPDNIDLDDVYFTIVSAPPIYLPGDINGDGAVNNKDVTRLMRYIKYKDVEVVSASLDVNGDGTVNNKDVTRLMRFIKYHDVEIH